MEEPTTNNIADERLSSTPQPFSPNLVRPAGGTTTLRDRWGTPATDQHAVTDMLVWLSDELGTERARFIRLLPTGVWIVQSLAQGKIVAQPADRAEIAMAWSVALSEEIYSATRPRVTTFDGDGVRPIAVTAYLAIPVLTRDGLAGVIEAAGELKPGAERIARAVRERLVGLASQLTFDPAMKTPPRISMTTECDIAATFSSSRTVSLSDREWDFVYSLIEPKTLGAVAEALNLTEDQAIEMATSLVERGLVALQTSTAVLQSSTTSPLGSEADLPI